MQPNGKIWFPAKKYGLGWGPPCCWQGWLFTLIWFAVLICGALLVFRPDRLMTPFLIFTGIMLAIFITVCVLKGEKLQWR